MSMKDNSREIWKEENIRVAMLKESMEIKSVIELRTTYATDILTPWLQRDVLTLGISLQLNKDPEFPRTFSPH